MTLVNAETGEIIPTLEACEDIIERGLGTFVEVGNALLAIRDGKLYRADYDSFDSYCRSRWGFKRAHAHRLIESAEVVGLMSPIGDTPMPANEAQARALAPLKDEPDKMASVWKSTVERTEGKPTARAIADAVADAVAEQKEQLARKAEDRSAIAELSENARAAGLDMDEERMRQRGEFARLCRDIAKLPEPTKFIKQQGEYLRERHGDYAADAHAWLNEFMTEWRNR